METPSSWPRMAAAAVTLMLFTSITFSEPSSMAAGTGDFIQASEWTARYFSPDQVTFPFSFLYGNQPSTECLPAWQFTVDKHPLDAARMERDLTWTDPQTQLEVRCVVVEYVNYPAIEWTVYFKNKGAQNTPILERIQAMDVAFPKKPEEKFVLDGINGDWSVAESYTPYEWSLAPTTAKTFFPGQHGGKSTSGPGGWPYFNLATPAGRILIAAGWPGQWAASFTLNDETGLRVCAGQQLTHLYLKPGEEIRTPLMVMFFTKTQDLADAQNLWRRWFIEHNMPRIDGKPQQPVTQIQVGGGEDNIPGIQHFIDNVIKPDICWRDAGAGGTTWYPSDMEPWKNELAWLNTGTWEIDPAKYPNAFKPFSDWVHAQGMQFLLWFEPERVGSMNTWIGQNHPEWVLPCNAQGGLLNEGDPDALNWLIEHIDAMIKSQGIDWYREDMNGDGPLPGWRKHDAKDRQGITENFYVQGHLRFWDELRRRNPSLRIDSCASGGRRNDIETMRRAVPLTRSDFQFPDMQGVIEGNQGHTYGLSFWLPFQGTGCYLYTPYAYRSFYLPLFGMGGLDPSTLDAQKKAYTECQRIAPYLLADYYPLTEYSLAPDTWIAWQFNNPEDGAGVIQAFRRPACETAAMTFLLRGLAAEASYEVENFDAGKEKFTGAELMKNGLKIELNEKPASALIMYKKEK